MTISADRRPTLIVMAKEPRPGRVKTRLGRDIGMTAAAWWFRHRIRKLLRDTTDKRWKTVLAIAPDPAVLRPVWPAGAILRPQGKGDLGQRMARQFALAGPRPAVLVGADIPGVGRQQIAEALAALRQAEAVFGPATDGGYWLAGFRHPRRLPATAFRNVRWSTCHALADTLASLPGMRVAFAETLRDIDTVDDLTISLTTGKAPRAKAAP